MNFSLFNIALFGAGALLIAAAIKGKSPQELIAESVGSAKVATGKPAVDQRPRYGPYTDADGSAPDPNDPTPSHIVASN